MSNVLPNIDLNKKLTLNHKFSPLTPQNFKRAKFQVDSLNNSIDSSRDANPIKISATHAALSKLNSIPNVKNKSPGNSRPNSNIDSKKPLPPSSKLSETFGKFNSNVKSPSAKKENNPNNNNNNNTNNKSENNNHSNNNSNNNNNNKNDTNATLNNNKNDGKTNNALNNATTMDSLDKPIQGSLATNRVLKKKKNLGKLIAPIDPNLYKVDMQEVIKKYENIKQGNVRKLGKLDDLKMTSSFQAATGFNYFKTLDPMTDIIPQINETFTIENKTSRNLSNNKKNINNISNDFNNKTESINNSKGDNNEHLKNKNLNKANQQLSHLNRSFNNLPSLNNNNNNSISDSLSQNNTLIQSPINNLNFKNNINPNYLLNANNLNNAVNNQNNEFSYPNSTPNNQIIINNNAYFPLNSSSNANANLIQLKNTNSNLTNKDSLNISVSEMDEKDYLYHIQTKNQSANNPGSAKETNGFSFKRIPTSDQDEEINALRKNLDSKDFEGNNDNSNIGNNTNSVNFDYESNNNAYNNKNNNVYNNNSKNNSPNKNLNSNNKLNNIERYNNDKIIVNKKNIAYVNNQNNINNINNNDDNKGNFNYQSFDFHNKKANNSLNTNSFTNNAGIIPEKLFSVIESIEKENKLIRRKLNEKSNLLIRNVKSLSTEPNENEEPNSNRNSSANYIIQGYNTKKAYVPVASSVLRTEGKLITNHSCNLETDKALIKMRIGENQEFSSVNNNYNANSEANKTRDPQFVFKDAENQSKNFTENYDKNPDSNLNRIMESDKMLNIIELESNEKQNSEPKSPMKASNNPNNKIEIYTFPDSNNQKENSIKRLNNREGNENAIKSDLGSRVINELKFEVKNVFCIYCLRSAKKPIILSSCKHELCMECAKEYISITDYLKNYDINHIKCPKCKKKSYIKDKVNFEGNLDYTWLPTAIQGDGNVYGADSLKERVLHCDICPGNKPVKEEAKFECLNCDIVICLTCKTRHLVQPRHQSHKIVHLEKFVKEKKIESTLCEMHKEPNKLYCVTEQKPCCIVCTNFDNIHENHEIKSIRVVIENANTEISKVLGENEEKSKYFQTQVNDLFRIKGKLEEQKMKFEKNVETIFEQINSIIAERKANVLEKINKIFNEKINKISSELRNLNLLVKRHDQISQLVILKDIEVIDKLNQSKFVNKLFRSFEKNNVLYYGAGNFAFSTKPSAGEGEENEKAKDEFGVFLANNINNNFNNNYLKNNSSSNINNNTKSSKSEDGFFSDDASAQLKLLSLNEKNLNSLNLNSNIYFNNLNTNNNNNSYNNNNFIKENILDYEKKDEFYSLKNSILTENPARKILKCLSKLDFIPVYEKELKILRHVFKSSSIVTQDMINSDLFNCLPKIKSAALLYKVSVDGADPKIFHDKCDNRGPTLTIVKLDDNHIFGGFNPLSWINEFMYNQTEDSFLFSISDGKYRKPVKCPVKKSMAAYAIKQNQSEYSPGFGETDKADLFIAFKNLKNSYSNLGNVYKCPEGYNPQEFLAGRPNNWNIVEVEVYAVETDKFVNIIE